MNKLENKRLFKLANIKQNNYLTYSKKIKQFISSSNKSNHQGGLILNQSDYKILKSNKGSKGIPNILSERSSKMIRETTKEIKSQPRGSSTTTRYSKSNISSKKTDYLDIKRLENQIKKYEFENKKLKLMSNQNKHSEISALRSEEFVLKARINKLNNLIAGQEKVIRSLSPQNRIGTYSGNLSPRNRSTPKYHQQFDDLAHCQSVIQVLKRKIKETNSDISELNQVLRDKQLSCRKKVVQINKRIRIKRLTPENEVN